MEFIQSHPWLSAGLSLLLGLWLLYVTVRDLRSGKAIENDDFGGERTYTRTDTPFRYWFSIMVGLFGGLFFTAIALRLVLLQE